MRAQFLSYFGGALIASAMIAGGSGAALAQTCPLSPPAGTTCINGGGAKSSSAELTQEFSAYTTANPGLGIAYDFTGVPSIAAQNAWVNNNPALLNTGFPPGAFTMHFATSDSYVDSNSPLFTYNTSNPNSLANQDGPYIQIPLIGIPVAIPVANAKVKGNTLPLNDNDLCGIFSGRITNWGATSVSTKVKAGTITVVYRKDSTGAGTTFLLTQHLAAVCNSSNSAITFSANNFFAQLFGVTNPDGSGFWNMPPSFTNFVGANGLTGEAAAMLATTSGMGYLSPDYTSIAPTPVDPSYKAIHVAKVFNATDHLAYLPDQTSTIKALRNPGASAQNITAPATAQAAANQLLWAPIIPTPAHGYPVVGLTNLILSQCYKNPKVSHGIINFFKSHYNGKFDSISTNFGYVPASYLLGGYLPAIKNIFLSNHAGFHLNINDPTACAHLGR